MNKVKIILVIFILFNSCKENPENPIDEKELTSIQPSLPVFVFKKTNSNELLAASSHSFIYKSLDDGNSWKKNPNYYDFEDTDIHGNIYAINSDYYLCKSEDNCKSWKQLDITNASFPAWQFFINSDGNIIKSYHNDFPPEEINFVNIDSYSSRKIFTSQDDFIQLIFITSNDYIFVFADGKLYRSKNNGFNWNEFEFEINSQKSSRVIMRELKNNYLYVSIQNLIFYSTDFGDSWNKIATNMENIILQYADENKDIYFFNSANGYSLEELYLTSDNFITWVNIPLPNNVSPRYGLFVDENVMYLPIESGGLMISEDLGQTWLEPEWYE